MDACLNGVKDSFEEYYEWSNSDWLWLAPEYLLTVNIAKRIWSIPKRAKFVTLEDNVRGVLKDAEIKSRGRLKESMRPSGRSDIIIWWGKGTPRGIIEVKNAVYQKSDIQMDLDRIYGMLEKASQMQFGAIVFYMDRHFKRGNAKEILEERINEKFIEPIKEEAKAKGFDFLWKYKCIATIKDTDAAFAFVGMISKRG